MNLLKVFVLAVWYPIVYWLMNVGTIIVETIRTIKKKRGQRAVFGLQ